MPWLITGDDVQKKLLHMCLTMESGKPITVKGFIKGRTLHITREGDVFEIREDGARKEKLSVRKSMLNGSLKKVLGREFPNAYELVIRTRKNEKMETWE